MKRMKPRAIEPEIHDLKALEDNLIDQIKALRKELRMSQTQFGKACNVCQPVIARIESKSIHPCITTIIKILAAFGKTIKVVNIKGSR